MDNLDIEDIKVITNEFKAVLADNFYRAMQLIDEIEAKYGIVDENEYFVGEDSEEVEMEDENEAVEEEANEDEEEPKVISSSEEEPVLEVDSEETDEENTDASLEEADSEEAITPVVLPEESGQEESKEAEVATAEEPAPVDAQEESGQEESKEAEVATAEEPTPVVVQEDSGQEEPKETTATETALGTLTEEPVKESQDQAPTEEASTPLIPVEPEESKEEISADPNATIFEKVEGEDKAILITQKQASKLRLSYPTQEALLKNKSVDYIDKLSVNTEEINPIDKLGPEESKEEPKIEPGSINSLLSDDNKVESPEDLQKMLQKAVELSKSEDEEERKEAEKIMDRYYEIKEKQGITAAD